MAAQGILFADYANHPKPRRLYLDSSFAIALLFYELNHTGSAIEPRHVESYKFFQALDADGIDLTGSVLTYSELLHYYCFVYPGGMYDLAKQYCKTNGVTGATSRQERYKIFVRDYAACNAAWQGISHRVGATEHFLQTHKILLRAPLPSPLLSNITKDVVNYASILKDAFAAIEATDSLHLSIAQYLDSDAVATLDAGFLTVDSFKVYYTN
jgi:predicted nucleic acid-binding protein